MTMHAGHPCCIIFMKQCMFYPGVPLSLRTLYLLKWEDKQGHKQNFRFLDSHDSHGIWGKWRTAGILLGLTLGKLDKLFSRFKGVDGTCWQHIVETEFFLKRKGGKGGNYYPATWEGLCCLLEDIQSPGVAEELKQAVESKQASITSFFADLPGCYD